MLMKWLDHQKWIYHNFTEQILCMSYVDRKTYWNNGQSQDFNVFTTYMKYLHMLIVNIKITWGHSLWIINMVLSEKNSPDTLKNL